MPAVMEKVDKRPAKADGPLYEVIHSIYDSDNSLSLECETVIQTHCENWVRRMGSMLSDPATRIPPNYDAAEVFVITGCMEDAKEGDAPAEPRRDDVPTAKQARKGFQRKAAKKPPVEE
jgi:hypothetical protein